MRHRSNIAFILLAAALFAAPQMAHDLSTLKGAVAARVRGEILQAFLGLHANDASATGTQAPRAELALVARGADKSDAQPAPQSAQKKAGERSSCPTQRNDANTQARTQTAMLTDPADKTNVGLPPSAVAVELASLPRQVFDATQLAMLTPPGNGVEPPAPPARASYKESDARTTVESSTRVKFAELERHAVFVQARFERDAAGAEWLRRFASEAARAGGNEGRGKARVVRIRRQGKACGGDNTPCAFVPVPVASLARPDAATPVSDGE